MEKEIIKEHIHEYYLNASQCNARKHLPFPSLVQQVIEVATEHADRIGVGYDEMIKDNLAWVLSRLTIEVKRMPRVREKYRLITWIENYNRHFSERNMEIQSADGEVLGYVRTIWLAIDIDSRTAGDLSRLVNLSLTVSDRPCPIAKQNKLRAVGEPTNVGKYQYRYTDIDFNVHVNSVKYVELVLNQWPLEYHQSHGIKRFEIAYLHEAFFGEEAIVNVSQSENIADIEILGENGGNCRSKITFE